MVNSKKGFTLAEVLITLLIIGVISSIVIPSLINDSQDAELRVAWKKTYSSIAQVTKQVMNDNGGTMKGLCSDNDHTCFANKLLPYLNYTRSCASGSVYGNCWNKLNKFTFLDGTPTAWTDNRPAIALSNGAFVLFIWYSSACTNTTRIIPQCGVLQIDINGFKGPNRIGKDINSIHIVSDGIKPYGAQGDNLYGGYCDGSTGIDSGRGCAAKYLVQ